MAVLRTLFLIVGGAAYVFFAGFALLWSSDVILGRAVYWGPFLAGWVVMAAVGSRLRPPRLVAWVVGGLVALGCCMAAANLVWPLSNPTSGGFLTGRGVVNYIFLPWLHTAFWMICARAQGRTRARDERQTG